MNKPMDLEKNPGWREARSLTLAMYRLSVTGNLNFDLGLRDSLRKKAIAIMSHLSLGQNGFNTEFQVVHLYYSRASTATLYTLLMIAREVGYIMEGDFLDFEDRIHRISDHIENRLDEFGSLPPEKLDFYKWMLDSSEI